MVQRAATYKDWACLHRDRLGIRCGTQLSISLLRRDAPGCPSYFSSFSLVLCQNPPVVSVLVIRNHPDRVDVLEVQRRPRRLYSSDDIEVVVGGDGTNAP